MWHFHFLKKLEYTCQLHCDTGFFFSVLLQYASVIHIQSPDEQIVCRWRGEACWLRSEGQRHRVIWLLARVQLPELKIVAKCRTSFTPGVAVQAGVQLESPCGTEDLQSPLRRSTIFGSKDWSSGTCWPVFLQNSYNTLTSLFWTSGLVILCCVVCFCRKRG